MASSQPVPMAPPNLPPNVSHAYVLAVPTVITFIVAMVLTGLRMWVRFRIIKLVSWDDFFNILAAVVLIPVVGLIFGAMHYGLGRHIAHLEMADATQSIKLLRITEFLLIVSTVFVKISISLYMKRLFLKSRMWGIFFWIFIAFNTSTSLVNAIAIFPQCTPVAFNWDKAIPGGHCWSDTAINALGLAQGIIAAITDIILATLPIFFLWNIKIAMLIKVGICAIMALGYASAGFAIARTAEVPGLPATKDPTWDLISLSLWGILEATFGVIAAAAPSVRPILGRNSLSNKSYYANDRHSSKPGALPLRSRSSQVSGRQSWGRPGRGPMQRLDESTEGEDGSSDRVNLWANMDGGIIKTMDVEITRTAAEPSGAGRANRSSDSFGLV